MQKLRKRKWIKCQKSVYVRGRDNFFFGKFVENGPNGKKNVHLYIVGDKFCEEKFKATDQMVKKCTFIRCGQVFQQKVCNKWTKRQENVRLYGVGKFICNILKNAKK